VLIEQVLTVSWQRVRRSINQRWVALSGLCEFVERIICVFSWVFCYTYVSRFGSWCPGPRVQLNVIVMCWVQRPSRPNITRSNGVVFTLLCNFISVVESSLYCRSYWLGDRCVQYVQSMEHQLQVFNVNNERLRAENISLKRKLALLLSEVHWWYLQNEDSSWINVLYWLYAECLGVLWSLDAIRDAILMCARKLTRVSLIYDIETTTEVCNTEKN